MHYHLQLNMRDGNGAERTASQARADPKKITWQEICRAFGRALWSCAPEGVLLDPAAIAAEIAAGIGGTGAARATAGEAAVAQVGHLVPSAAPPMQPTADAKPDPKKRPRKKRGDGGKTLFTEGIT